MATFTISKNDRWPPLPTIAELAAKEIEKANYIGSAMILAGFDHEINGVRYHFSYRTEDQTNFSNTTAAATTSQALGAMSDEQLKKIYGTTVDGALDKSNLPQPLPEEWRVTWQGHADGKSVVLTLNLIQWLQLDSASHEHRNYCLNECRLMKEKLRAAKSEEELNNIVAELDLDMRQVKLRDKLEEAGVAVLHV